MLDITENGHTNICSNMYLHLEFEMHFEEELANAYISCRGSYRENKENNGKSYYS